MEKYRTYHTKEIIPKYFDKMWLVRDEANEELRMQNEK